MTCTESSIDEERIHSLMKCLSRVLDVAGPGHATNKVARATAAFATRYGLEAPRQPAAAVQGPARRRKLRDGEYMEPSSDVSCSSSESEGARQFIQRRPSPAI